MAYSESIRNLLFDYTCFSELVITFMHIPFDKKEGAHNCAPSMIFNYFFKNFLIERTEPNAPIRTPMATIPAET